jgi:hypothetical protein
MCNNQVERDYKEWAKEHNFYESTKFQRNLDVIILCGSILLMVVTFFILLALNIIHW